MKSIFICSFFVLFFLSNTTFSQVTGITSSNLPLVIINTNGQSIQDASKITANMKLIYNGAGNVNKPTDAGNIYNGIIGIEYHGGSSSPTEQNAYGFETRDASGNNLNVSLLGMPEQNDWILLANFNDKIFVRNILAFQLFRKMAHYAPRTQLVEVIVNNDYQGIYVLTEKIKQDKGRVDISKLTNLDVSGDNLTGGYIFKIDSYDATDSWQSTYPAIDHPEKPVHYVYEDPTASKLVSAQKNYLKATVNSFESVLNSSAFADQTTGYPAWIKMNSFLDFFIVSEVSRNINGYKKNCYYFKDKDSKDNKFHSGPVWDFDLAFKNLDACAPFNATDGSGWSYKINDCPDNSTNSNGWINRLLQDPAFANAVNSRYFLMRNSYLSLGYLNSFIDSVQNLVKDAEVRHYAKWKILSASVGAAEVDAQPSTYDGQITKFKNWLQTRLTWLDGHMVGNSTGIDDRESTFNYRIFPNPVNDVVYLESSSEIQSIGIFRTNGTCVLSQNGISTFSTQINVSGYSPGIYLLQMKCKGNQTIHSKLVIQ
jgi:hypothetical protein